MDINERMARLEAKLDMVLMLIANKRTEVEPEQKPIGMYAEVFFRQFTQKQNCTLQMLLRGASNDEIADRFGVSENTSKVHVRGIAKKLGVNTRAQILIKTLDAWNEIDDESYRIATGGLPKNWDSTFKNPDPFRHLYGGHNEFEDDAKR